MLRVVQVGLGPIGRGIAGRVRRCADWELVGAVDPHPSLAGRDLGQVLGGEPTGIEVSPSLPSLLERTEADLALHATGSFLRDVTDELRQLLDARLHVVSTCEELSFPFHTHPGPARELDAAAQRARVVLLGTGVNPGFVMDKLVVTLMSACDAVAHVRVRRVVDAGTRRAPFQRKIGAGLSTGEFERLVSAGRLGHVGLAESAHMLAEVMGLERERKIHEELRPVIAAKPVASEVLRVEAGQVVGIDQCAALEVRGTERIRLELRMYLGAERPCDAVSITGSPSLEMEIGTGIPGDEGTAALTIHSARLAPTLAPGLRTMLDVPLRPWGAT